MTGRRTDTETPLKAIKILFSPIKYYIAARRLDSELKFVYFKSLAHSVPRDTFFS